MLRKGFLCCIFGYEKSTRFSWSCLVVAISSSIGYLQYWNSIVLLSDRAQRVKCNYSYFGWGPVFGGISQGSALRSLLFLNFVNDMLFQMWPDLPVGVLYTHSFKIYFSSPSLSYINAPTAHLFNIAEGWTVCFHVGLFLKPVWCPWVLGWPLNGPIFPWQADSRLWITTQLADEFAHGFSCFVWHVEVHQWKSFGCF